MTKKEYIINVLEKLQDSRELAPGLLILVQSGDLDDDTIDALTDIFKKAIKTVSDKVKRDELQAWIDKLQAIKQAELDEKEKEAAELQEMEELFA